jgi:hypothetical protein
VIKLNLPYYASRPYSASIQFRVLSSFTESAFYPHLRNPLPQSVFRFRVLSQPNKTSGVYCMLHISSVGRQFKTFKIKYLGAFGLKILSKWREKWDESTGIRPKKRKPMMPKLSRIKRIAFFIIWAICQQIIQFRLAFKYKGHKSLEYCCQLFSNTVDIRKYNFSFASTISYAESNGGIFNKYKVGPWIVK